MADTYNLKDTKNYYLDVPMASGGFHVRGAGAYDWGMQNRLSKIFRPESGKTVMLAIDHGYFQGPTAGLERVDVTMHMQTADAVAKKVKDGTITSSPEPIPSASNAACSAAVPLFAAIP